MRVIPKRIHSRLRRDLGECPKDEAEARPDGKAVRRKAPILMIGFIESFIASSETNCRTERSFYSPQEAKVMIESWRSYLPWATSRPLQRSSCRAGGLRNPAPIAPPALAERLTIN
jgi:hypothetical protein